MFENSSPSAPPYDGEDDEPTMTIKLMMTGMRMRMATVPRTAAVEFVNALRTRCYLVCRSPPMELLAARPHYRLHFTSFGDAIS